jgi:hypothetical protein
MKVNATNLVHLPKFTHVRVQVTLDLGTTNRLDLHFAGVVH